MWSFRQYKYNIYLVISFLFLVYKNIFPSFGSTTELFILHD